MPPSFCPSSVPGLRTRGGCISKSRWETRLLGGLHFWGAANTRLPRHSRRREAAPPPRDAPAWGPPCRPARPGLSGRRAPVARKCPGSGWRRGKRGRGARRGGPTPYVAAFLPPASSPSPVSPRRGPAPSSRRPNQWLGGASLSGRGRGVRAGPGAPAPCRPPLAERRWRRRRLGENEQRAGARSVSEGTQPPARPPPLPPLCKQETGPGPGTLPQPLPRRQAARAARASQGEGERAGAGRRRPDRASARACGVRGSRCPPPSPSLLSPSPLPPPTAEQHHVGACGQSQ